MTIALCYMSKNMKKDLFVDLKVEKKFVDNEQLIRKGYTDSRLHSKSKCYTCEQDMANRIGEDATWIGESSRCFDCTGDLIKQTGKMNSAFGT